MDFEQDEYDDAEPMHDGMIPVIPEASALAQESSYPYLNAASSHEAFKSVSAARFNGSSSAPAPSALEDPQERDILELLAQMDDFEPIIPETLTDYYMTKTGVECDDPRLKKLVALVAQKFISDIAMDAMQFSRMRQASSTSGASESARKAALSRQKQTLTMEDLSAALAEHGINIRKPPYHL